MSPQHQPNSRISFDALRHDAAKTRCDVQLIPSRDIDGGQDIPRLGFSDKNILAASMF